METFAFLQSNMPTVGLSLFMLGWITQDEMEVLFINDRRQEFFKRFKHPSSNDTSFLGLRKTSPPPILIASIVPYLKCQALTISLSFVADDWTNRRFNSLWFQICDNEHADDCEQPPNGIISPRALSVAFEGITQFCAELKAEGLGSYSITLGQCLVDHCDALRELLLQGEHQEVLDVSPAETTQAAFLAAAAAADAAIAAAVATAALYA